jgi:hypothetical protein
MERTIKTIMVLGLMVVMFASPIMAASDFEFPTGWKNWIKMKEYSFPCYDLAGLPKVAQNVGTIYCPLFTENSVVTIYARPEAKNVLDGKAGEYPDGPNFIFAVTAVKGLGDILLVKGHDLGDPVYGVFKVDGTDIEGAAKAISKSTCVSCHDAYCRPQGVCSNQSWNNLK